MYRILRMIYAWFCWNIFKIIHAITYKTVVVVLTGEDVMIDYYCIQHLNDFAKRKYARKKIVIYFETVEDKRYKNCIQSLKKSPETKVIKLSYKWGELFYDFYSFHKFFDNIIFTYTSRPEENLLFRVLKETNVNEEDAACLALYHLRYIPQRSEKNGNI